MNLNCYWRTESSQVNCWRMRPSYRSNRKQKRSLHCLHMMTVKMEMMVKMVMMERMVRKEMKVKIDLNCLSWN